MKSVQLLGVDGVSVSVQRHVCVGVQWWIAGISALALGTQTEPVISAGIWTVVVLLLALYLQQVVEGKVTVISGLGVHVQTTQLIGRTHQLFVPHTVVAGLCVYEAISQQSIVWRVGLAIGLKTEEKPSELLPLFASFKLSLEDINDLYQSFISKSTSDIF